MRNGYKFSWVLENEINPHIDTAGGGDFFNALEEKIDINDKNQKLLFETLKSKKIKDLGPDYRDLKTHFGFSDKDIGRARAA